MGFLIDRWNRIGTKLYLALGFAVFLTLVSSAVGVYYFERSGDLSDRVRSESVPGLEAAWATSREAERLLSLSVGQPSAGDVSASLDRLEKSLSAVSLTEALSADAERVNTHAFEIATVIDNQIVNQEASDQANSSASDLQGRLNSMSPTDLDSAAALALLGQALTSPDEATLDRRWQQFASLYEQGIDPEIGAMGREGGVFDVRGQQLALESNAGALAAKLDGLAPPINAAVSDLLLRAQGHSTGVLDLAVHSFDRGRILLTAICVISVVAATAAAWLWVGNGMVRRLSRLSSRMRHMADGDLQTPVPEVGQDEIGELADALEVFRQQALEVQRLNLVEKLYEDLRVANEELQRMQARLVAQEKLAALGELVSGVAHEISNPLNFVMNFSEGSLDLYNELSEMLAGYRDKLADDDTALLDEITQDLTDNLARVCSNGGRALAIVERMRSFGDVGGDPVMTDLNQFLRQAVQTGCDTFTAEWQDFALQPTFDFDESVESVPLVDRDFGEAILNLVSNACYAMRTRHEELGDDYEPSLLVSTRRSGDVVNVVIKDNGPGIPDDVVGHIFNPFFSTRDGAFGAGLGLTIAADVARRHGGDLTVDTAVGEHATFTMTVSTSAPDPDLTEVSALPTAS